MIAPTADLLQGYRAAFEAYLRNPSEAALHAAYELGRHALSRELSILDLATLHHEALLAAARHTPPTTDIEVVVRAANDFFLEALSAFEMLRRGYREAQEAALVEKRHALILRQLSNFLADASVALNATDSLGEVLQLVAEQARELTGAECSVARVQGPDAETIEAVSYSESDANWQEFVADTDLSGLLDLVEPPGNSARRGRADLADLSTWPAVAGDARELRSWLATTLIGWDGGSVGSIQLFDKTDGDFSESDEAVLVHLAQMAVTAVERARRSA